MLLERRRLAAACRLIATVAAVSFVVACADKLSTEPEPARSRPQVSAATGDTVEHGYAKYYRGDSVRITVNRVSPNCDISTSILIALWDWGSEWLSQNACADSGRLWAGRASASADSTLLFMTTAWANPAYGNSNRMVGSYPKYTFLLTKDWTSSATFGDLEVCVEFISCTRTGDTILDTKSVRDSLLAAMARSNPDTDPRLMQRREVGGLIFQHVDSVTNDTSYYFKETPSYVRQTACQNGWGIFSGRIPRDKPVGSFHTHPSAAGDTVYGCNARNAKQTPGGPGTVRIAGDERKSGGGSEGDWDMTLNPSWPIPQYVMTKSGLISRLNYGTPKGARKQNPNIWYWKSNPNGCRAW